jgi:hypothetical protein
MENESTLDLDRTSSFFEEIAAQRTLRFDRRLKINRYPTISVLIATLRPTDLTSILKQIFHQTLPSFELVLGLHGFELRAEHKTLIAKLKKRSITIVVVKCHSSMTLGQVLTQLAETSSGQCIAKMDDDDLYGSQHLRDLADAMIDSRAEVVGRAMNYVYLEPLDITVRRFSRTGTQAVELFSDWVCGGTILAQRSAAEEAGWFGEGRNAVDRFILGGVTQNGGKIWRTFGAGYIYRRSFTFHTYVTNYSKYLKASREQVVGIWEHEVFGTESPGGSK